MMKEEIMERAKYNRMILDEFMKINSSVVILDVEPGDQDDTSVPCDRGRWLKVITKITVGYTSTWTNTQES